MQSSPKNVLEAAQDRIAQVFDSFEAIFVAFSAGKDSSVLLDLVCAEARRRDRRVGIFLVDLEAQYKATIEYAEDRFKAHQDVGDPFWIALPLQLRNATSQLSPYWMCWDPSQKSKWVRQPPKFAITNPHTFPWFFEGMEFEEFVEKFGHWYGQGQTTCGLVGIRTSESLNRWRSIVKPKQSFQGIHWTTTRSPTLCNAYPIYDWRTEDIWTYNGKFGVPYNPIYDLMHQAGLSIHDARICQPYGDDQRKGMWLYHILEPETWPKIAFRVAGANTGALYAKNHGNILGRGKITKPPGHSWESFSRFLLSSLPPTEAEHYRNKIAVFLHWYTTRGWPDGVIPDEADPHEEARRSVPSWRRICKVLLKNDRLCKGLGFAQHQKHSFERYSLRIREKRTEWGLL